MKQKLLIILFFVIKTSLFAQTNTINETQTISVTSGYTDNISMTWNIQSSEINKPLIVKYSIGTEYGYDFVKIYSIDTNGTPTLVVTLSGIQNGCVSTVLPTGKAMITFTSDASVSYTTNPDMYSGINITFAVDNSYPSSNLSNSYISGNAIINGNVGIGILNPGYKLDINGSAKLTGEIICHDQISFQDNTHFTVTNAIVPSLRSGYQTVSVPQYGILAPLTTGAADLWLSGNSGIRMFSGGNPNPIINILPSGNVGIGTTVPDQRLTVNGIIHAKEVRVDLTGPLADYVFSKDYFLMPLHKVEQYVQTHSHLPDIPSALEIKNKGLSMGEMQNKLLQKIEELTLYAIEQQKEIQALKEEVKQLKK